MPKLTLSMNPAIIQKAKSIANKRGTSVSVLFSQSIESLSEQQLARKLEGLPPTTRRALVIAKIHGNASYRSLIEKAMAARQK